MTFGKKLAVTTVLLTSAAGAAVVVPALAQEPAQPAPAQEETVLAQHFGGPGFHFGRGGPGRFARGPGGPGMMGPQLLEQFDADDDGKLTQAEIDAGLSAKLGASDTDNSGALSLDEFEALWLEQTRPMMVRFFQNRDADGDGSVTAEEFARNLDAIVARMDRNGDGALDSSDRPARSERSERSDRRHHRGDRDDR
jgi:Ca2+-binding EF-hand superfamily protein